MISRWNILGRGLSKSGQAKSDMPAVSGLSNQPMLALGERNELLQVRFGDMVDRLEDLKSLSSDFQRLVEPFGDITAEITIAKARILELEAVLSREAAKSRELTREAQNSAEQNLISSEENLALKARLTDLQEAFDRLELSAADEHARNVELAKRLTAADQINVVERETRLRLDAELAISSKELNETVERLEEVELSRSTISERAQELGKEVERQQEVIERQVVSLVELQGRRVELEKRVEDLQAELATIAARAEAEKTEREKSQHRHDVVKASLEADNSSLMLRIDALSARMKTSEQSLAQARQNLNERDSAVRTMQGALNSGEREIVSLKRQITQLSAAISTARTQAEESQRLHAETGHRCEMLTKALSAKDVAMESAAEKIRARDERLEDLIKKNEHEKAAAEEDLRKLVEELENERAERTLAQGALKIARESRASLQRLNESLRKANRDLQAVPAQSEPTSSADDVQQPSGKIVTMSPRDATNT